METKDILALLLEAQISFTVIERKILGRLLCGETYTTKEIVSHIYPNDPNATVKNVGDHVVNLRKKLAPLHHSVICEVRGRKHYYRYVVCPIHIRELR